MLHAGNHYEIVGNTKRNRTKRFASAYQQIQASLQNVIQEQLHAFQEPYALLAFDGGVATLSDDQLRTVERDVLNLLSTITLWDTLAGEVLQQYDGVLKAAEDRK